MLGSEPFSGIVGIEGVFTSREVLDAFAKDAGNIEGKAPAYVLRPRDVQQVQKIVRLANDDGLSLVPCSSGGPHTRGDTLPQIDEAVVVDLSGMDRIVRVDRRNKVALVEPGVCFGALQDAASDAGLRVSMPLLPRANKSVVGSLLEREPTLFPKYHWDMSDPLCCVEVIFGAGDLFRTGSAAGPGTLEQQWKSGQAQKSPMGPSQTDWAKIIQGAQGTMGIVTWASVKLENKPGLEKGYFAGGDDLARLVRFMYGTVKPRLPDVCLLLNRTDLLAICGEPPQPDLPEWVLFYSISGYKHLPRERVAYLEKDIEKIASHAGVAPPRTSLAGLSAQAFLERLNRPSAEPYWKTVPAGAYQDLFFLTTLDQAQAFVDLVKGEAVIQGLPEEHLGVYIQPVQQGRACHLEFTFTYDPADKKQAGRIRKLSAVCSTELINRGAFFSRPYGPWAELAYGKCPDTVAALRKVKGILDPKGVMNPGKLCF